MKKIKVLSISMLVALVVAISLFALTGCGGNNESLEGTWQITSMKIDNEETLSNFVDADSKFCVVFTGDTMQTETIDKDGNVNKNPNVVTIKKDGNKFTATDDANDGKIAGTINGNKLTITEDSSEYQLVMEATKQK